MSDTFATGLMVLTIPAAIFAIPMLAFMMTADPMSPPHILEGHRRESVVIFGMWLTGLCLIVGLATLCGLLFTAIYLVGMVFS